VGLARRLGGDGGRRRRRQARVAGLADLDRAVIDELGDRQAGGGSDDDEADRPLWRQHRAGPGRGPNRQVAPPQQPAFERREQPEEANCEWPQPAPESARKAAEAAQQTLEPRPAAHQHRVGAPIGRPRPGPHSRRPDQDRVEAPIGGPRPGFGPYPHDHCTAANRCYHRPSLRLLLCSSFRRALRGLFHAPTPAVPAGGLRFLS
jgi:hypothetical protein